MHLLRAKANKEGSVGVCEVNYKMNFKSWKREDLERYIEELNINQKRNMWYAILLSLWIGVLMGIFFFELFIDILK